jgi:predicted secreted protein
MNWTSIVAIYFLFWVMGCFITLRLGMKTADEAGTEKVPGQADSAPAEFRPGQILWRGTVLATVLFALYYANWVNGWITADDLLIFSPVAGARG